MDNKSFRTGVRASMHFRVKKAISKEAATNNKSWVTV